MSATLQIIAVMKTLGAITLKDHSVASVNQATMEMDTIVQVKSPACVWLTHPLLSFKNCDEAIFFSSGERENIEIWRGGGGI